MEMKNKLIKHHKNSMHFYFRDLAIIFAFAIGVLALISVPTYISVAMTIKSQAKATQQEVVENSNETEEVLEYQEVVE